MSHIHLPGGSVADTTDPALSDAMVRYAWESYS